MSSSKDYNDFLALKALCEESDDEFNQLVAGACEVAVNATRVASESHKWGGSKKGKSPNIQRDFAGAYDQVVKHYFPQLSPDGNSLYTEGQFERRYAVPRTVFNTVFDAIHGKGEFCQQRDATGKPGIDPLVRATAVFRCLVYGTPLDSIDENLQISESELAISVKEFCASHSRWTQLREFRENLRAKISMFLVTAHNGILRSL